MNENKAEFVGFFAFTDLLFHHIGYNETSGVVVSEMSVGCMLWCVFFLTCTNTDFRETMQCLAVRHNKGPRAKPPSPLPSKTFMTEGESEESTEARSGAYQDSQHWVP